MALPPSLQDALFGDEADGDFPVVAHAAEVGGEPQNGGRRTNALDFISQAKAWVKTRSGSSPGTPSSTGRRRTPLRSPRPNGRAPPTSPNLMMPMKALPGGDGFPNGSPQNRDTPRSASRIVVTPPAALPRAVASLRQPPISGDTPKSLMEEIGLTPEAKHVQEERKKEEAASFPVIEAQPKLVLPPEVPPVAPPAAEPQLLTQPPPPRPVLPLPTATEGMLESYIGLPPGSRPASPIARVAALEAEVADLKAKLQDVTSESQVLMDAVDTERQRAQAAEDLRNQAVVELDRTMVLLDKQRAHAAAAAEENASLSLKVSQLQSQLQNQSFSTVVADALPTGKPTLGNLLQPLRELKQHCGSLAEDLRGFMRELQSVNEWFGAPLMGAVRHWATRTSAATSRAKQFSVMYKQVCQARQAAHDQLWAHKKQGSIRVVCRVAKPVSQKAAATKPAATIVPTVDIREVAVKEKGLHRRFQFDQVFDEATPLVTSLSGVDHLVHTVVEGDNACLFSGTTSDLAVDTANAIHAHILRVLFAALGVESADPTPHCSVTLSYVDVCLEHLYDMLSSTSPAPGGSAPSTPVKEGSPSPSREPSTQGGLTIVEARRLEEAKLVARAGVRRRLEAAKARGDTLSRSHGVLTVCVSITDAVTGHQTTGKLHVVELATGVRAMSHALMPALPADEMVADRSLSVFCELASIIRQGQRVPDVGDLPMDGVTYAHSKLTVMLQDSLGNGRRSLLLVTVPNQVTQHTNADASRMLALGARVAASGLSGAGFTVRLPPALPPPPNPVPLKPTTEAPAARGGRGRGRGRGGRGRGGPPRGRGRGTTTLGRYGRVGATTRGRSRVGGRPARPKMVMDEDETPWWPQAATPKALPKPDPAEPPAHPGATGAPAPVAAEATALVLAPAPVAAVPPQPPTVPPYADRAFTTPMTLPSSAALAPSTALAPVPHPSAEDPVPGMRRLLLVLRRSGGLERPRFAALQGILVAADAVGTGMLDDKQFGASLRRFVPEISQEEVDRLMGAMHLTGVPAIDYTDFVNALMVLAEGDSRAPRATDPPTTTPKASLASSVDVTGSVMESAVLLMDTPTVSPSLTPELNFGEQAMVPRTPPATWNRRPSATSAPGIPGRDLPNLTTRVVTPGGTAPARRSNSTSAVPATAKDAAAKGASSGGGGIDWAMSLRR